MDKPSKPKLVQLQRPPDPGLHEVFENVQRFLNSHSGNVRALVVGVADTQGEIHIMWYTPAGIHAPVHVLGLASAINLSVQQKLGANISESE